MARASLEEAIAAGRAQLGEKEVALASVAKILRTPGENCLTPVLLRLDPSWDPLRNEPRFQEMAGTKR